MSEIDSKLTRIGVFYDGNYFFHVSNYYYYSHPRRARLSIPGLHEFIREQVAHAEKVDTRYCQVVDSHYFRGRLPAHEANARHKLLQERVFDDILMKEGVITHYLPLGRQGEKGIDVWLALEAFELALFKKFNVLVLIVCDGDYVPLVRKLNTLGTRVMVLGWDFQFVDELGNDRSTTTSRQLLSEVTYPLLMHSVIDDKSKTKEPLIQQLFVYKDAFDAQNRAPGGVPVQAMLAQPVPGAEVPAYQGRIVSLKEGYGFVSTDVPGKNLFFFWQDLVEIDFNDLRPGDVVQYVRGRNDRGECAREITRVDPDATLLKAEHAYSEVEAGIAEHDE
ncbi:MAG: NYN domain-containing protein [Candidatus Methylacidiphilales bacterium]|nr:NYN domain-containing protein [Candidatus Methylacidiphilales bacterium]